MSSGTPVSPPGDSYKFDLFVSYTRTPDGALAREIERFLEAFHQTPLRAEAGPPLRPLQICVDGSDFSSPAEPGTSTRDALGVVEAHLAQSRELLVLCSARAAQSYWVAEEVRWFLAHRGPGYIRVAYTEGARPWEEPARYFVPPAIERRMEKKIAYDLRGYDARRAREWVQVPEFPREIVRLAADLLGRSGGDLYPTWLEAELARTRRQSLTLASTARFETLAGDPSRALLIAYEAHELHPGDVTERALREAYKVAVLHHHNRRELARISGSGPSYLAGRWKQGEVFTKSSYDGKYRLVVTERGKDGPHPPGDVYLVNHETLRVVKLEPPKGHNGRVEDAAFDRAGERVFVTRYFNLACYATDGRFVGQYEFSRHTKSPVHLLDGFFYGKYILGAETKGGVWLVDLGGDRNSTLTVHGEFYNDATIFTDISADQKRALLVYESGRAAIVTLTGESQPKRTEIPVNHVLFAGFAAGAGGEILTADDRGGIVMWDFDGDTLRESTRMKPLPTPVDWVTMDAAGKRLAAVGAKGKLFLLDRASGDVLHTLDYSEVIDWAAVRAVVVPERALEPGPVEEFSPAVPFPSPDLLVSNLQTIGDETWMLAENWPDNAVFASRSVHRVRGTESRHLSGVAGATVETLGGLLWMRAGLGYGGALLCRAGEELRRFVTKDVGVNCVLEHDGAVWVGTPAGAYHFQGNRGRLITPAKHGIESIAVVGGRLWLWGREGAHVFEQGRLCRVSDPFLGIRGIKAAGGAVWILSGTSGILGSDGPAYLVHGYFTTAQPHSTSKVSNVLEADGAAWLAERDHLHRVRGAETRTIEGISSNVNGIVQVGRTLWLTTWSREFMGGQEQTYQMNADTLEPVRLDLQAAIVRVGAQAWLQYPRGERMRCAEPREDGLRELTFGDAGLNQIVEHRGESWFLTSTGIHRHTDGGLEPVVAPALSYHAVTDLGAESWLLASNAAVRMRDGVPTVFRTGEHKPRAIRQAGGRTWILTDDGWANCGPVYRVAPRRAVLVKIPEAGVSDVIELEGRTWLLTRAAGRAGVLRGV